jgi:hypothetical protein
VGLLMDRAGAAHSASPFALFFFPIFHCKKCTARVLVAMLGPLKGEKSRQQRAQPGGATAEGSGRAAGVGRSH